MERVDVVVVGDHLEGLAAAWGAAEGGVRAVLISRESLPRTTMTLCGVQRGALEQLEIPVPKSARVANQIQVEGSSPCAVAGDAALLVMPFAELEKALLQRLRHAGVEIREKVEVLHTDADSGGWRLQLSAGEPIRAPIIIVADGARSATLSTLGIAQAQRFTASAAEVMNYLCATWPLSKSDAEQRPGLKVIEAAGPLSHVQALCGKRHVTAAVGPIWRGVGHPSSDQPSPAMAAAEGILARVQEQLGLSGPPADIEEEAFRLDALPSPATFDGGLVVGSAAGHRCHEPLTGLGPSLHSGKLAGEGAARCIIEQDWRAGALAAALNDAYSRPFEIMKAELALQAHGLRVSRPLGANFWRASDKPA